MASVPTLSQSTRILGAGLTPVGKLGLRPTTLMQQALEQALGQAGLTLGQVQGLVAIPSLAEPHFMEAHYLATRMRLLPRKDVIVRTIDTGGAGPVTGLLMAARMIEMQWCDVAAVVAGDAVSSLSREEFLRRADQTCQDPEAQIPSPVIPNGYDRVARWNMQTYGVTREQLAMCTVLMSHQAVHHPLAMLKRPLTLEEVLQAPAVAPVTTTLESARRADGGAAIVLASEAFLRKIGWSRPCVRLVGGGEGSGPLYPPPVIDEDMFSCEEACATAYRQAGLSARDIDFFGLYDCFPICLLRAIESVGLAPKGKGGAYIENAYLDLMRHGTLRSFPINTHGGLLAFGAPWEVPAMYNIIEAYHQLTGQAGSRQIPSARRALIYGNGGIFSASAVAILEACTSPAELGLPS